MIKNGPLGWNCNLHYCFYARASLGVHNQYFQSRLTLKRTLLQYRQVQLEPSSKQKAALFFLSHSKCMLQKLSNMRDILTEFHNMFLPTMNKSNTENRLAASKLW